MVCSQSGDGEPVALSKDQIFSDKHPSGMLLLLREHPSCIGTGKKKHSKYRPGAEQHCSGTRINVHVCFTTSKVKLEMLTRQTHVCKDVLATRVTHNQSAGGRETRGAALASVSRLVKMSQVRSLNWRRRVSYCIT